MSEWMTGEERDKFMSEEQCLVSSIKKNKDGTITVVVEVLVYTSNGTYSAHREMRLKK